MTTLSAIQRKTIERRAVDAGTWGMPILSVHAMRRAYLEDAGAEYNDIVYWSKLADWKNQTTTPNSSSYYVYVNFNTSDGPVVLDIPRPVGAGLFGTILDAWQLGAGEWGTALGDTNAIKYLILPPGYDGDVPEGYTVARPQTYNGFSLIRSIPLNMSEQAVADALALVKQLKVYPLSEAGNPAPQRFIDMAGRLFDGIVHWDENVYADLAQILNEEPVLEQDRTFMGLIKAIGIEKGKEFAPSAEVQEILAETAKEAHQWLMDSLLDFSAPVWKSETSWRLPGQAVIPETASTFQRSGYLDVDARSLGFFSFYALPMKLGPGTYYFSTFEDSDGNRLRGEETYRLRVPANVPAKQFWSLELYDVETCGFIKDMPHTGLDSFADLEYNEDGSVDLYIGPKAPEARESNWAPTSPGRMWFPYFRFYGPDPAFFEDVESWKLPEFEHIG